MSFTAISTSSGQTTLTLVLPYSSTHTMGEPSWQETLRLRLVERNAKESAYAPIIEQCTCIFVASDLPRSGFITIL